MLNCQKNINFHTKFIEINCIVFTKRLHYHHYSPHSHNKPKKAPDMDVMENKFYFKYIVHIPAIPTIVQRAF